MKMCCVPCICKFGRIHWKQTGLAGVSNSKWISWMRSWSKFRRRRRPQPNNIQLVLPCTNGSSSPNIAFTCVCPTLFRVMCPPVVPPWMRTDRQNCTHPTTNTGWHPSSWHSIIQHLPARPRTAQQMPPQCCLDESDRNTILIESNHERLARPFSSKQIQNTGVFA